jgi:hypothetical protein
VLALQVCLWILLLLLLLLLLLVVDQMLASLETCNPR